MQDLSPTELATLYKPLSPAIEAAITRMRQGEDGIVLLLSPARRAKLDALAQARRVPPEIALLDFIDRCAPGGSGWVHPTMKGKAK